VVNAVAWRRETKSPWAGLASTRLPITLRTLPMHSAIFSAGPNFFGEAADGARSVQASRFFQLQVIASFGDRARAAS